MTYSNVTLVALLAHCILNHSVFRNQHYRNTTPAGIMYRWLMLSMLVFYIFDVLWGVLYDAHMIVATFVDTSLYFVAMAATVFFWTRYVIAYLREENRFIKVLRHAGTVFLGFVGAALALNCFVPIMFWFDEGGAYHAGTLRYVFLAMQLVLFSTAACYMLFSAKHKTSHVRRHHLAIGSFGIAMSATVTLQVVYPLLPMYSVGCLLGTCILHTFVLEDLMEDRRIKLEEMVRREEDHKKELGSVQQVALRDSLTGVKNKHAYVQREEDMDEKIRSGEQESFAVVVCDINNLKMVNDTYGHNVGDTCIKNACAKICTIFSHSPVFRIGGDEFVVLLSDGDFNRRESLMVKINEIPEDRSEISMGETVAAGIAEYEKERHTSLQSVFEDADKAMYERKQFMKMSVLPAVDNVSDGAETVAYRYAAKAEH